MPVQPPRRWVTSADTAFYRSGKRNSVPLHQSARPTSLHRIWCWPSGRPPPHGELRPPPLRPAWLHTGGVRPWSEGAAVSHSGPAVAATRRCRRAQHRGCRAGRRVQRRRHRADRDSTALPGAAPVRCLVTPVRLTRGQAERAERAERRSAADGGGGSGGGGAPTSTSYRFGHVNTRSLTPRMDAVNLLIQEHDIDILAISETWLRPSVSKRVLVFPGYHITRCDRTNRPDSRARVRGVVSRSSPEIASARRHCR